VLDVFRQIGLLNEREQDMKRLALSAILLAISASSSWAQAIRSTTISEIPFEIVEGHPCIAEPIQYSGVLQEILHEVLTSETVTSIYTITLKGVSAIGLDTGTVYRSTGGSHTSGTTNFSGGALTTISNSHFVAPGSGLIFSATFQFHTTVNANGELVAVVENGSTFTCH
jgi:hypothetical protein